ncbi:MAG: ABC transporter ATP-binding protein [SAR324 cluster bacterium]|nr:ABC transporter ATP-binding protein [SAR324 cluster bacterium]
MGELLEVKHLSKSFAGIQAVNDISFSINRGELVSLIGPNGAGKSTCFNMLNGQIKPDKGSVRINGRETVGMSPDKIWKLGVGRTFQITATFYSMTVLENVRIALINDAQKLYSFFARTEKLYHEEAMNLLEQVGIVDQRDRLCGILAYGDLKRVELAVALANNPGLLLMDEPTAGMSPKERVALMALTHEIVKTKNIAALFTEHDMDVVFNHASRIMVLARGSLIASGMPDEIKNNQMVQEIYLGASFT